MASAEATHLSLGDEYNRPAINNKKGKHETAPNVPESEAIEYSSWRNRRARFRGKTSDGKRVIA